MAENNSKKYLEKVEQELRLKKKLEQVQQTGINNCKKLAAQYTEYEEIVGYIDRDKILGNFKLLASYTSTEEVWRDYRNWLIPKGFKLQDLEQK